MFSLFAKSCDVCFCIHGKPVCETTKSCPKVFHYSKMNWTLTIETTEHCFFEKDQEQLLGRIDPHTLCYLVVHTRLEFLFLFAR